MAFDSWKLFVNFSLNCYTFGPSFTYVDSWFDPVRPMIRPVGLMIRPCSTHDSTLFDSWFDPVILYRLCSSHDATLFDSWFDPVRLMIRPCSTHDSTRFDSWFDPVRPTIRPCSTHDSTLFDSWFDPVRLMIRPCSTHDSTRFDPWFDPVRLMIRPCSTHDWTLFESWFDPVRLMIRPCSTLSTLFDSWFGFVRLSCSFDRLNLRRKSDSVRPCRLNHESNTSAWDLCISSGYKKVKVFLMTTKLELYASLITCVSSTFNQRWNNTQSRMNHCYNNTRKLLKVADSSLIHWLNRFASIMFRLFSTLFPCWSLKPCLDYWKEHVLISFL